MHADYICITSRDTRQNTPGLEKTPSLVHTSIHTPTFKFTSSHIHTPMCLHKNTPQQHLRYITHEGSATEDSAEKPSIYCTHQGTGTARYTHRGTEKKMGLYSTDLVHNACGRAHLSVGILWILLNMRSSLLRIRIRAGRTASDDQSVIGNISMM